MFKILTLNNISPQGLERLPRDQYEIASEMTHPDAIMVRSAEMHKIEVPGSVKAIGRAGAGVNNIPVPQMTQRGVVVFNAPGANANAVKELVLAGMFLAARNVVQAAEFVRGLQGDDKALHEQVEAGKKKFKGFELPGRTLGVVGLGAIGVRVANSAMALGMRAIGYDPSITVQNAWQMNAGVQQALSVDDLLARSDFVTLHVPLVDATRKMINTERLRIMRRGAVLLNFAREGIVDSDAVRAALDSGKLHAYVCDFPSGALKSHPRFISLPHLGASTDEAEDNCAVMVADQLREFLEDGSIRNSVNFPEAVMPRLEGTHRIAIVNANVPNMVGQMSGVFGQHKLNIADLLNKSKGEIAYTLVDTDQPVPDAALSELRAIQGVLSVRRI
ncbi:MAG: phosphoglycerate dehydrogenase [Nevskiales bacterium]